MDLEKRRAFHVLAFLWKSPFLIRLPSSFKTYKNFLQSTQKNLFFRLLYYIKKVIYFMSIDNILNYVARKAYALDKSIS